MKEEEEEEEERAGHVLTAYFTSRNINLDGLDRKLSYEFYFETYRPSVTTTLRRGTGTFWKSSLSPLM